MAQATSVQCGSMVWPLYGKVDFQLNSTVPSIKETIFSLQPDGSEKQITSSWLSQTKACSYEVNFAQDCRSSEGQSSSMEWHFAFRRKGDLSGYFSIDENNRGTFTCNRQVKTILDDCHKISE